MPRWFRSQAALAVAGGLFGLAFAIALFLRLGPDTSAPSQLRGFEVLSDSQVRIEVEVARSPGAAVFCGLRARGADGGEVGRTEVDVPVSRERSAVITPVLMTSRRAVTGELLGCRKGRATPQP